MYEELVNKKASLAVIGLGYVGLPLACAFAQQLSVIGFDINKKHVGDLQKQKHEGLDLLITSDPAILSSAQFFIITVPTPVDRYNVPDLKPLLSASEIVGKAIMPGSYVVYESTTYPGCTEEDCLPVLENISGLKVGQGFKLGYSPERINTGDVQHTLQTVTKVVAGNDAEALNEIARVYELVVQAGVYRATSIKVAEAAKIVENTQRDLNIALMNELSLIFDRMGLNTYEVIEAASTKWNFLKFYPGLVGGHCIGVDPYYLTHKAASLGYFSRVIAASRQINDDMARYVARKVITHVLRYAANPCVLVKGLTFKENVQDIRNSKILDTVKELLHFNIDVDVEDPCAKAEDVYREYGLEVSTHITRKYDAVIITVPHQPYLQLDDAYYAALTGENGLIVDLKGIYRNKITSRKYWSL